MGRLLACLALLFPLIAHDAPAADKLTITIHVPKSGSSVDHRHEVSGRVSDPNADVWVVTQSWSRFSEQWLR
jgi:hypothetical protein